MLLGWVPVILLPTVVFLTAPAGVPRWQEMWMLALAVFAGVKWLTFTGAHVEKGTTSKTTWSRILAYWIAWPGLDADAFLAVTPQPLVSPPRLREWMSAGINTLIGGLFFWGIARLVFPMSELAAGWIGMAGFILFLHCGVLQIISCLWRANGVDARSLMNTPLLATSLSDFWGRRWNTAFRDLVHKFVFRPMFARWGSGVAMWCVFLFSGIVHDVVISGPTQQGYGGPTLFFLLQAAGIQLERSAVGKWLGLGGSWRGWCFALLVIVLPAGLLFQPLFITRIVLPTMRAAGAL